LSRCLFHKLTTESAVRMGLRIGRLNSDRIQMMVCMLYKIYSAYPSQQSMAPGMMGRYGKIEEAPVIQAVPEAIQEG